MHKKKISITTEKIEKKFGKTLLFRDVNFTLVQGDSFYITGPNGSGKSTLLQILAGIQKPSSGNIIYTLDNTVVESGYYKDYFGFTGPQVNPYDMLTSLENLRFTSSGTVDENMIIDYLEKFDLYMHRAKAVKYYSSGMKQRLRLIHALINNPQILMLDEPCSNLDSKGRDILYRILDELKKDKMLIIATNESEDINLCSKGISLEQNFK
jgi:ABC-type multidrug transport system ATPase subunit